MSQFVVMNSNNLTLWACPDPLGLLMLVKEPLNCEPFGQIWFMRSPGPQICKMLGQTQPPQPPRFLRAWQPIPLHISRTLSDPISHLSVGPPISSTPPEGFRHVSVLWDFTMFQAWISRRFTRFPVDVQFYMIPKMLMLPMTH